MSMTKKEQRLRRSRQTRQRIANQSVVRLAVHRSSQHIYAAIVSDDGTKVLASASTAEKDVREQLGGAGKGGNVSAAAAVGIPRVSVRFITWHPKLAKARMASRLISMPWGLFCLKCSQAPAPSPATM